jgi:hypothetical protein
MPGWGDVLNEITEQMQQTGTVDIDGIRRRYLRDLQSKTGRSVVVYATDFAAGPAAQINLMDMQGLMEVFRDLPGPNLDLILHSPGGQAEATDRLVRYMRSKFDHIRVFVPLAAMSAATMWAMAADEIVMGKHSQLGPIDPQITLPSGITVPAGALIEQFQTVSDECAADPSRLTGWLPTLQQYPPGLLNVCETAGALAKELVGEWLGAHMLSGNQEAASEVAEWLSNDHVHLSHSRAITRDQLRERGLNVVDLEDDQDLQDAVLSVHHAVMHTLSSTPSYKLIENHIGRAFIQSGGQIAFGAPGMLPPGMMPPGAVLQLQVDQQGPQPGFPPMQ